MDKDYNKNYNKGNDCDSCKHQYFCGRDGDITSCSKLDNGEECEYIECDK